MALDKGTKLGRYEIRSKIGEGGMGEVYRARDDKLNRDVAIKVLPVQFSQNADRLRRFEQEAQAAGALNHHNILAIYDVDTHDGAPFVVSELLDGESLRERLQHRRLSGREAIDFGLQIARGLSAAHDRGIVHRDLKPENIFITSDGRIKILDFGLAKLTEPVDTSQDQTDVPTRKLHTDPGTILGTVGYMSPEQAMGTVVDHRSDIFSLGVVLYEMLTGERAFTGASAVETLNAIIKEEPRDLSEAANVSRGLQSIVRHCLEKKRERRFQSAGDVAFSLETLSETVTSGQAKVEAPPLTKFRREHVAWAVAAALLLTTIATLFLYFKRTPTRAYASRFLVYPPEKGSFAGFDLPSPVAVSPDGSKLVLSVNTGVQQRQLFVRALDSLAIEPLANTEGALNPFWSPDGRFIGFFAGGKLKKIAATGGLPTVICDAPPNANSGTWNSADLILFTVGQNEKGILKVSAAGGEPVTVITPDHAKKEIYQFWPYFLPDGKHFLYLVGKSLRSETAAYVGSIDGAETKFVMKINSRVVYAPPGFLLYVRDGTLLARPFDAASLSFTGDETTVGGPVGNFSSTGNAYFSVSANGEVLAYYLANRSSRLVWLNRSGVQTTTVGEPNDYWLPRVSPDGKKVAVNLIDPKDGTDDIWIHDLERGTFTRFTFDPGLENGSLWSRDGRSIVYARDRDGPPHLFQKSLGDSGEGELLLSPGTTGPQYPLDFSPDGKFLIYQELRANNGLDLFLLPMSGERKPVSFANTQFNEFEARISPDGKWVAYVSDQTGRREVYVKSFPGGGEMLQISNGGGTQPRWNRTGGELFFVWAQKLMSVTVKSGDKFEATTPVELSAIEGSEYDVSPDGQHFLVRTVAGAPPLPLTVAIGWSANLKH